MMGSVGPLLQRRSDMVMAIWRSCPNENPCYRIATTEPACTGQPAGGPVAAAQPVNYADGAKSCKEAQETNHSCAALLNDPVYSSYINQNGAPQNPNECQRAKSALLNLDQEVDRMSLRIKWYQVFASQGF